MKPVRDMERILTRVALQSARPRDLVQLRDSLAALPEVMENLSSSDSPRLRALLELIDPFTELHAYLAAAIDETPPVTLRDGGVIAAGFDHERTASAAMSINICWIWKPASVNEPALPTSRSAITGCTGTISRSAVYTAIPCRTTTIADKP